MTNHNNHNLPLQSTPFVGRSSELIKIAALLSDPTCRLLTLLGPGGIGKTRLALAAAADQFPHFANGVFFAALTPINTPDHIPSVLASALQVSFYGTDSPRVQIMRHLREKQMLLVMDNFEHLLAGFDVLTDILQAAPDVKLLVTSRERLNIREEWTLALDGLSVPDEGGEKPLETFSAVQLFLQRARQAQANFSLGDNAEAVKSICQRVEGMPLGLELAASWLRAMSCAQVAAHMGRSLDFLMTPLRNVPERHRNLRAVFEQSWSLLADDEKGVLARLSVFRGGFDLEAAGQIAGATLPLLAGLVDKSLIRLNASGRYDLHELLRQFVAEKLSGDESSALADSHLAYFLRLAEQCEAHIYGRLQLYWLDRTEAELDNIRAALAWVWQSKAIESGLWLASTLRPYWEYRQHLSEGLGWMERFLPNAEQVSPICRIKGLRNAGELAGLHYYNDRSRAYCLEALALARQANDPQNIAWSLSSLGFWGSQEQSSEEQEQIVNESIPLFREVDDSYGLSHALRRSAMYAIQREQFQTAQALLDEALSDANAVGDRIAKAWILSLLGDIVWLHQHDSVQSVTIYEESIVAFREIGDDGGAIFSLNSLARIALSQGENARALAIYQECLSTLKEMGLLGYWHGLVLDMIPGIGILAARSGQLEQAARLLGVLGGKFQETEYSGFSVVSSDVDAIRRRMGETAFANASAEGRAMSRIQIVTYALELEISSSAPLRQPAKLPLAEPLSPRELEVLPLIAEGLTNAEIAYRLSVSLATVKVHTRNIYGKLGVNNRTQAVTQAQKLNLL